MTIVTPSPVLLLCADDNDDETKRIGTTDLKQRVAVLKNANGSSNSFPVPISVPDLVSISMEEADRMHRRAVLMTSICFSSRRIIPFPSDAPFGNAVEALDIVISNFWDGIGLDIV